jgi:Cysteine-rich secretory protein family
MNLFHKHFTPHEDNDFRPHPMRHATLLSLGAVALALFLVVLAGQMALQGSSLTALVLPRVLIDATNNDRKIADLTGLTVNPLLQEAAQDKADDMASKSYFAHTSPDGKTPWYWFDQVGYNYKYAGENLAIDFSESADVETAWMNSPEHRANILDGNFTEIGMATADGFYEGHPTTYVVELFGRPALAENWSFNLNGPALAATTPSAPTVPASLATTPSPSLAPTAVAVSNTTPTPTPASTRVLGQSEANPEAFVAVERVNAVAAPAATPIVQTYSAPIERAIFSSSKFLEIAYGLIAFFIFLGLAGIARSEYKKHHLPQVALSVGLLAVMAFLLFVYHSVLLHPLLVA